MLGRIDPAEQERLEVRLLTDADFHEELAVAENEIVHDYLTGALSEQEKESFDRHFLCTPERRQKLQFFDTLIKSIDGLPKPLSDAHLPRQRRGFLSNLLRSYNPFLKLGFAVAVLVLVIGAGWVVLRNWQAGGGDTWLAAHTVILSPSKVRDAETGQTTRVKLPAGAGEVRFQLPLSAADYKGYRATLTAHGGAEKFESDDLEVGTDANRGTLTLSVPSRVLAPGDYELMLYGLAPNGDLVEVDVYYFRIIQ